MSAGSTFEGLPGWAKGAIAVGSLGLVTLIGFSIRNGIKKRLALAKDHETQRVVDSDIKDLKKQGQVPSLSKSQMATLADELKVAFDGYGTDGVAVARVFDKMKTDLDVLALIDVYGIRKISSGRFNPEPDFDGGLAGAMLNELDSVQVSVVNSILAKKNIKFRF